MKYFTLLTLLLVTIIYTNAQQIQPALLPEKREMFLQQASKLRQEENYTGAIQQLDSILNLQPKDAPVLLFKGDLQLQNKQFGMAAGTYQKLLPLKYESTITRINLSYALFMNHHPMMALQFAQDAWRQNPANSSAIVNCFNALLWNVKTKEAAAFLKQQQKLLSSAQLLVLKARLYTTSGNYNTGLQFYDSLVKAYPDKYFIQEYSEVLLGKKEFNLSASVAQSGRKYFSISDSTAFAQKYKAATLQNAGTELVYFKDVAKNIRIENSAWWQQGANRVYQFRISAGVSSISSAQNEKTKAQFANVAINERWSKAWTGESMLHLQLIKPLGGSQFAGLTGRQLIQYQPNDRRMMGVFVSTDILNFTASLLTKNIRSNNVGYVTHLMMSGKTGFYSQGSFGTLTDKNQRYQMFASVYHLFRTEPTLKSGLNFSALHFSNDTIKNYFSPRRYLSTEVFADYTTALPQLSKFYVMTQAAAGMQKIEKQPWDPALRLQAELGLRLKHIETALKYQTSNVASAAGTGYSFNWYTLRFIVKW
jgi:tetratricopeptide (TPR) repeat protein